MWPPVFEGYRSANTVNDNFSIQFSTNNGKGWSTAFTVSNSTQQSFSYAFSSPLNGTVLVRAIDTNTTSKAQSLNTLYVDQLAFSTGSGSSVPRGKAHEGDSIIGASRGGHGGGSLSTSGDEDHAEEHGMHVLPIDLDPSPLAGSLSRRSGDPSPYLEPDPLTIWHPILQTLA
jgi:hypothetical protein